MTDKKAFQSNVTAAFGRMNKHPYSNRAIPSCEMARTFSFIYALVIGFPEGGGPRADVGEYGIFMGTLQQISALVVG